MAKSLKKALLEYGQYRDVRYIKKDGTSEEKRCLIVPAVLMEPLLERNAKMVSTGGNIRA